MPGRFAICLNPRCRDEVPYTAGRTPPKFCAACRAEFARVSDPRETPPMSLTAQPRLPKDGRVAPIFLDDQETW